eukprot:499700-Pyramimonas_sp.AAC.1
MRALPLGPLAELPMGLRSVLGGCRSGDARRAEARVRGGGGAGKEIARGAAASGWAGTTRMHRQFSTVSSRVKNLFSG